MPPKSTKKRKITPTNQLPAEIINHIFGNVAENAEGLKEDPFDVISICPDRRSHTVKPNDVGLDGGKRLDVVEMDGYAKAFKQPIADVPEFFQQYLSETGRSMMYSFHHPSALINFGEILAVLSRPDPTLLMQFNTAIFIFDDDEYKNLAKDEEEDHLAHGYFEDAHSHVNEWMEAVQTLPSSVTVYVVFCQPWLDFRSLHGVTTSLRRSGERQIRVGMSPSVSKAVKGDFFLVANTIAAVTGERFEVKELSEVQLNKRIRQGCRGFQDRISYIKEAAEGGSEAMEDVM